MLPQRELVRVAMDERGELSLDRSGPGRGCWLCAATASRCAQAATKRHRWARGFRRGVEEEAVERFVASLRAARSPTEPERQPDEDR